MRPLADHTPAASRVECRSKGYSFHECGGFWHRNWDKPNVPNTLSENLPYPPVASAALRGEKMLTIPELVLQQIEFSPTGWCWKAEVLKISTVKEV